MSELEIVEREYRALATKLIYGSFQGQVDPEEQRQLEQLSDRRVTLSAPDLAVLADGRI